jgi:hypothetical protein
LCPVRFDVSTLLHSMRFVFRVAPLFLCNDDAACPMLSKWGF